MRYIKYLKNCGAIVGHKEITDDPSDYETPEIGFYPDTLDEGLYYFVNGEPLERVLATGLIANKTVIKADGIDTITISNLPTDAWLRINELLVQVNTTYNFTTSSIGTYKFELVGKYYTNSNLFANAITVIQNATEVDPKWVILKDATPTQIEDWVNNNVTTLADAKELFILLLKSVRFLYDRTK